MTNTSPLDKHTCFAGDGRVRGHGSNHVINDGGLDAGLVIYLHGVVVCVMSKMKITMTIACYDPC